ncbi:hypothetical protein P691DRAFT_256448 [Macrolepiota fuliginosa MF-IS2]|uniref:Uncharacterized protein n=1 Tax=Macrolepiota fuliginosa MF-IS2 TaxID=1400762 RepID=A0A9P5XN33_9AGAR|nr:hypothetical protein P691DRAFT_256448 [Macrolepiota fuliginosa MF-IS2]
MQRSAAGSAVSSRAPTPSATPKKKASGSASTSIKIFAPPAAAKNREVDQRQLDISALGLGEVKAVQAGELETEEVPKIGLVREKLLLEAQRSIAGELVKGKKAVSIVVIGEFFSSPRGMDPVDG